LKIDILGTKYTLRRVNYGQDEYMEKMHFGGYHSHSDKEIVILNLKTVPDWAKETDAAIKSQEAETLRHEILHAFLSESGLRWNSFPEEKAWAQNEEMVDWFAIQFPKILKVYEAVGCLAD
jgi:hypothetical protein